LFFYWSFSVALHDLNQSVFLKVRWFFWVWCV